MEQFRQIGEVLGSLKALMVLKHDISINQRQCCLLYDILVLAFDTISEEIRQNLRLDERNVKWKALELPMKELHRIFKEADLYVRQCLDIKDWWGRAISLHMNRECVEFHIHNLLCCFPVVIEAIETAAEISGMDQEDMQKRRITLMKKYDQEFSDFKLFQWKFGKQYLVPRDICIRLDTAWKEDKWLLLKKTEEKKMTVLPKHEQKLVDLLIKKLNETESSTNNLMASNALVGAHDYYVKRRLGSGGAHFKEIHWLGENFALRTFYGDIEPLNPEISLVLSLSHPNVLQHLSAFYDEDRKEGFLVMELMSKDLGTYINENSGQRKRNPFSIPVAVDIMLQIARGMEYLHSKKIFHGDLNPSNILLKARGASVSTDGLFLAKITGFGLTSIKNKSVRSPKPTGVDLDIWLAPEVLAELEVPGSKCTKKYSEKADVYSFGMFCFELLTGKIPFKEDHLQGEKMVRNIRAGERPLFSSPSPKYLTNFTRKCWQTNPNLRPTFSSICRILRCIKKILVINPDHGHPDSPPPLVDYCDIETGYLKKYEGTGDFALVSQIPFQMFAYRLVEKEKISGKNWDPVINGLTTHHPSSMPDYEQLASIDDLFVAPSDRRSVCSDIIDRKNLAVDLRSVISEIPQRKLLSSDQRSIGSESPRTRFDRRSIGGLTPERKGSFISRADQSSTSLQSFESKNDQKTTVQTLKLEVPDKNVSVSPLVSPSTNPCMSPKPQESNILLSNGTEHKTESTEMVEKKKLQRAILEQTPVTGYHKLAEIPEKKILKNTEACGDMVSVSSKFSAKTTDKSSQKSWNSDKKPFVERKMRYVKTKSLPEKPMNESPRSSPARIKKTKPGISPSSSPSRTPRRSKFHASPMSSPLHPSTGATSTPKHSKAHQASTEFSSPVSSPLHSSAKRVTKTCCSIHHGSMDYSPSPTSSPLHTCTRCSRLGRHTSLPSSSPQRSKLVSDSSSTVM